MKRFGYFEKLSLAARWFLPNDEAVSMVEDYKDILYEVSGPEEAMKRFGPPWKPVMELADRKKVRRWHVAFLYMMFCTLFPTLFFVLSGGLFDSVLCFNFLVAGLMLWVLWEVLLAGKYSKRMLLLLGGGGSVLIILFGLVMPTHFILPFYDLNWPFIFRTHEPQTFVIGAVISLIYFGFGKMVSRKFSKPLLAGMLIMFLAVAGVYGFMYYSLYINIDPIAYHESFFFFCFALLLTFFVLGAVASIFLARLYDRRWRVVFILALAGIAMCLELFFLSSNHYFSPNDPDLFRIFYDRENPDYIFSNHWGKNINGIDEIFISFSWYTGVGTVLALIGLL